MRNLVEHDGSPEPGLHRRGGTSVCSRSLRRWHSLPQVLGSTAFPLGVAAKPARSLYQRAARRLFQLMLPSSPMRQDDDERAATLAIVAAAQNTDRRRLLDIRFPAIQAKARRRNRSGHRRNAQIGQSFRPPHSLCEATKFTGHRRIDPWAVRTLATPPTSLEHRGLWCEP